MSTSQQPRLAAIVLCGGGSTRMGASKAWLDFGGRPLLERVVSAVAQAADPVVVSAAPDQDLPELDPPVLVVRDTVPDAGPLRGFADALATICGQCDAAFVCACDAPFITPAYVNRLLDLLADHDAAVPLIDGHRQPLSAVYRVGVLSTIARLLADGRDSMMALLDALDVRPVTPQDLADVDPDLDAIRDINTPAQYRQALGDFHDA
ncbi:MAG TPA: molybdenum cofactor guanylyltransferase [Phycisphaerae bacterium]|nr:molybdenum cofactor guanylyltransferase [Phycisphaerae bacterium]